MPAMNPSRTLYDKLWDEHVVHTEDDGTTILYIDRHLVHEVTSPQAFEGLRLADRKVWRVSSIVATADHNTPTDRLGAGLRRHLRPGQPPADRHAGRQHQGLRRGGVLSVPGQAPGHRPRDRP
jgi:homoaconitase/3-isopropylmalate dehydratase large subunit